MTDIIHLVEEHAPKLYCLHKLQCPYHKPQELLDAKLLQTMRARLLERYEKKERIIWQKFTPWYLRWCVEEL